MKDQILKIAGVKSEKEFYKKYPSEETFMKVHGKAFKKAQMGAAINKAQGGTTLDNNNNGIPDYLESSQGVQGASSFNPGNTSIPSGINTPNAMGAANQMLTPSNPFALSNAGNTWASNNPLPQGVTDTSVPSNIGYTPPQAENPSLASNLLGGIPIIGGIAGAIDAFGAQKKAKREARMWKKISGLQAQAAESVDVDANKPKNYVRPEDNPVQPNQLFPTYGVGTNVLKRNGGPIRADYGAEIQNTYAPNTLYDDLGYEPLNDSNVKQYYHGGYIPTAEEGNAIPWGLASKGAEGFGANPYGNMVGGMFDNNAGSQLGGSLGSALGPGGGVAGSFIGGILDQDGDKIKADQRATQKNYDRIIASQFKKGLQGQYASYMEEGGQLTNPQLITRFGELDQQDFYDYAHQGMNSLRAGGHLREYTPISERGMEIYKEGGEIKYDTKNSIVDLLKSRNKDSDYNSRKQLAKKLGIKDYRGTADQNINMIEILSKNKTSSKQVTTPAKKSSTDLTPIKKSAITKPKPIDSKPSKKEEPIIKQRNPFGNIEPIIKPIPGATPKVTPKPVSKPVAKPVAKVEAKPVSKPVPVGDTKKTVTPATPSKQTPVKKTMPEGIKQKVINNPKADLPAEARKLQSGVITDKGTNMSHVIQNGKVVKSFPVLTGSARNWNINDYSMDYLETNHGKKGTPTGSYLMNPNADLYGEPGFDLEPIPAYGQDAPIAKNTAMHVTYPKEFARRNPLYTQSAGKRATTYGCTNCRKEDITELSKAFPEKDTAIYIDSRLPKDASFLKKMNQKEYGGEVESYRDGGNFGQQYAMGGEVKTTWGGHAETISRNPYMPGTGETIMFRGKSHDESDGNGHTGIGVTYGKGQHDSYTDYAEFGSQEVDANVEVERGEPAAELEDANGEKNLTVYGNLQIPNQYVDMLGDPRAKGKKFKNYIAEISKDEDRQTKLIDKSTSLINDLDVRNSFDKLKFDSLTANIDGANMKLKSIADKKKNAAYLQNAINDTAEENGLVADDLARGKIKYDKEALQEYAEYGTTIPQAQKGKTVPRSEIPSYVKKGYKQDPKNPNRFYVPGTSKEIITKVPGSEAVLKKGTPGQKYVGNATPAWKAKYNTQEKRDAYNKAKRAELAKDPKYAGTPDEVITAAVPPSEKKEIVTTPGDEIYTEDGDKTYETTDYKRSKLMDIANMILPFIRPTDQEPLDPRQLSGEMYALSTNKVEPVQAQGFQPDLLTPYDISLQSEMNEVTAQTRAAQKMAQGNPAAQALIAGQAYDAIDKIKEKEFIANQGMKSNIYNQNVNTLNEAKLKNLDIYDRQYTRQEQAKSNTKAITQAALNSISDKYSRNKLENRELGIAENMYNYRYDAAGRAINMNPLFQANMPSIYGKQEDPNTLPVYDASGKQTGWRPALETEKTTEDTAVSRNGSKTKKKIAMNGSIVKMYKTV